MGWEFTLHSIGNEIKIIFDTRCTGTTPATHRTVTDNKNSQEQQKQITRKNIKLKMLNRILIPAFLLFATIKKAESKPEFRPSPTKKNQNAFLGGQLSNIENKNDFVNAPSNLQKFNPSAAITENIQNEMWRLVQKGGVS